MGPGTLDVERGLDYVKKSREGSPNLGLQRTERQSPAKEDSLSPDRYEPNKEVTLYQSPKWTIGVRRPEDSEFPGTGQTSNVSRY